MIQRECQLENEIYFRYEIAIRLIDPELAVPYWDSTLDQSLPDARDSILWTESFFGTPDPFTHYVTTGIYIIYSYLAHIYFLISL